MTAVPPPRDGAQIEEQSRTARVDAVLASLDEAFNGFAAAIDQLARLALEDVRDDQ